MPNKESAALAGATDNGLEETLTSSMCAEEIKVSIERAV
jgi:hypothetical protein